MHYFFEKKIKFFYFSARIRRGITENACFTAFCRRKGHSEIHKIFSKLFCFFLKSVIYYHL